MPHEIPGRCWWWRRVIGREYACTFAALGVQVASLKTQAFSISWTQTPLPLASRMEVMGIQFFFDDGVANIECNEVMKVHLLSGTVVEVDNVLISSGRCGNIAGLELEKVGVASNDRGSIKVNESYQTTQPNIYAAGDVSGSPALASTSMEQARAAVVHACQLPSLTGVESIMATGIYTIPECSMVGESEESLKRKKIPFVIGKTPYEKNARGQIVGDHFGFLKRFPARPYSWACTSSASKRRNHYIGLTALMLKANAHLFLDTANYPTLPRCTNTAYEALGGARGEIEATR